MVFFKNINMKTLIIQIEKTTRNKTKLD